MHVFPWAGESLQTNTHLAVVFLLVREQSEYVAGGVESNILGEGRISTKYQRSTTKAGNLL